MLSSPRNPPAKRFFPSGSLRLTHQVKLIRSFWKTLARKTLSRFPLRPGDLVDAPRRPRVHGRVDVAEGPLVGGDLSIGMHVPLAQQKDSLLLGEFRVDAGKRDHVEREVPGRVPGVLPRVRHRDHVPVVEMRPGGVAALLASLGRRRLRGIPLEPVLDGEVKELLGPEEPRVRLPRDAPFLLVKPGNAGRIEGVPSARRAAKGRSRPNGSRGVSESERAQADDDLPCRGNFQPVEAAASSRCAPD